MQIARQTNSGLANVKKNEKMQTFESAGKPDERYIPLHLIGHGNDASDLFSLVMTMHVFLELTLTLSLSSVRT